jgi:hypothetical protein
VSAACASPLTGAAAAAALLLLALLLLLLLLPASVRIPAAQTEACCCLHRHIAMLTAPQLLCASLCADGGDRPVYAMQWAASEGVVPLTAYPYTPRTGDCQGAFDSRKVSFAGAQAVDLSKPDNILQALAKGPLAITIWADSNPDIQLYSTGIYAPPASSSAKEDHAVTLVGYGTETLASGKTADYWIIKNRQGWPLAGWWLFVSGCRLSLSAASLSLSAVSGMPAPAVCCTQRLVFVQCY